MYTQALAPITSSSSLPVFAAAVGVTSVGIALSSYLWPDHEGLFSNTLDALGEAIGPGNLDFLESACTGFGGYHLIKNAIDSTPFLSKCSLLTRLFTEIYGGFLIAKAYQEYFKNPMIHRKIEALQKDSVSLEKKALIIEPTVGDRFGGLQTNRCFLSNAAVLAKKHAILRLPVTTENAFRQSLQSLPNGDCDVLWIRTHGLSLLMELGTDFYIMEGTQILYDLASKVKSGGTVILESCYSGFGEWNIAKDFSKICPGAKVYAPKTLIHTFMGLEIGKDDIPSFNDGVFFKGLNVTRIYRAGKDQP